MDEKIKKMFSKVTDDFSSEDISFIKNLDYPTEVKLEDLNLGENDPNRIRKTMVEDINDLFDLFKKIQPNNKVVIPDISGKMTIHSRKDE